MITKRDREVIKWIEDHRAVTVNQATYMYFNGGYEQCRRRLKQLEDRKILKSYTSKNLSQKVYYQEKKISDHDILVYDFIKEIKILGACVNKFIFQPNYCKGLLRPDAYVEFVYNKNLYMVILEVDLNHHTGTKKFQMYEYLYHSGEMQSKCYGTFPILVVSRPVVDIKYRSNNFEIVHTDLEYSKLDKLLLYS